MDWESITGLLPALVAILLMLRKRFKGDRKRERAGAGDETPSFRRAYEPITPDSPGGAIVSAPPPFGEKVSTWFAMVAGLGFAVALGYLVVVDGLTRGIVLVVLALAVTIVLIRFAMQRTRTGRSTH